MIVYTNNMERKEKILKSCNSIPVESIVNYIRKGEVSLSELKSAGLSAEKVQDIATAMQAEENELCENAYNTNTIVAYHNYLNMFPSGLHSHEATDNLKNLDDKCWMTAISSDIISEKSLKDYKVKFPNGSHVRECDTMLSDLPWLQAKRRNTIQAYEEYKRDNPSKHTDEIHVLINNLNDDKDWNDAKETNTTYAYQLYIDKHPNGNHVSDAKDHIQSHAGHDNFIRDLQEDPNAYSAGEIQIKIENGVATWDDIKAVFGEEKADAIRSFNAPAELPQGVPPEKLKNNSTEVYFWGTPSSGKTCALGSIISSANKSGIIEPIQCTGYDYMIRLSNIFDSKGFCIFPDSTSVDNIQEMIMNLRDEKNKNHTLTLIDMAGELFRSAYFKQHNLFLEDVKADALKNAMDYLADSRNKKIHFFVVEYGGHDKEWEGLRMVNYLDNMVGFLKDAQVFKKSTVGVYVLVTKCDKINCEPEERPERAFQYVSEKLPSFWNTLKNTCGQTGVGDLKILSFSVGDVFAQNICEFNDQDTSKVIDKLLTKTRAQGGRFDWIKK
jgi:hypothetical protein